MALTLPECRDKVAQSLGYSNWRDLLADQSNLSDAAFDLIVNNVAKLNAEEKVKEALQLAAERAITKQSDDFGLYWVDKSSILSLSEELIKKIKKEI